MTNDANNPKDGNNLKKIAIGTTIAAAAGYIAGILTAPKSGKETRKDIKDGAQKGLKEAEKQLKNLHTELSNVIDETKTKAGKLTGKTKDELDALIEKAKDSKEKAREMLSALHEGDAQDKELQKAIKDASKAIAHLRSYLAK